MNRHEWMEPYSHRVAQWRIPESSGTGAGFVPLDCSLLMPTYSHAIEWTESEILVDVCSDLHPFDLAIFWWQNERNAWTWSPDDLSLFTYRLCTFNCAFATWSHYRTSRVLRNTVAWYVCIFISHELLMRTAARKAETARKPR